MKIRSVILWLVLMPTIIFIDIICFIVGIFSSDVCFRKNLNTI